MCKDATYVFELCTKWNKVVHNHTKDIVYLLSMFVNGNELSSRFTDREAQKFGIPQPKKYHLNSKDEIIDFIFEKGSIEHTWEGVVARDNKNRRFKAKNKNYEALHHLKGEGFSAKRLIPLILDGETDEVLTYFPEFEPEIRKISHWLDSQYEKLSEIWEIAKSIESQKEFALYILQRTKFSAILFNLKKNMRTLKEEFLKNKYLIIKVYKNE